MFYVYILLCSDNSYYTGHTDNLEQRLYQHNRGVFDCYTKSKRPCKLIFKQLVATRTEAFSAERQIKGWSRKKKEALIRGDWNEVSLLASRSIRKINESLPVTRNHLN
jgi:predicted GIY-YIG superfamily endonuclease